MSKYQVRIKYGKPGKPIHTVRPLQLKPIARISQKRLPLIIQTAILHTETQSRCHSIKELKKSE
nr:putative integron gene cassette protein [uncultured bacterium]